MGMYYYATVGYGIAIREDNAPKAMTGLDPWDFDEVEEWLNNLNLHNVSYKFVFNGGDGNILFFYNKDTYDTDEARSASGVASLSEPSRAARTELFFLGAYLGISEDEVGWKHIWHAS